MRNLTPEMLSAMYSQETDEVVLFLCKLSRAGVGGDVLLCNDATDVVHGGETYTAYPFSVVLPEDDADTVPLPQWVASNVSLDLVNIFRMSTQAIDITVKVVLRSSPDDVEIEFDAVIFGATIEADIISGTMAVEPVMDEPYSRLKFTPENNAGLFP